MLLREVVDGMALVRMNLLQLHLSDFCRFAVDLPGFPELNHSLRGEVLAGQYSVQDVREIVAYARDRGVMVLPEVDLPGHAKGLLPLADQGLSFCVPPGGTKPRPEEAAKVHDDPEGGSRRVLRRLLTETARVFKSDLRWFHVGGDEASPHLACTQENIVGIEAFVAGDVVRKELGLTPVAWEELRAKQPDKDGLRAAGDSTELIVVPWHEVSARGVARMGHRAIVANLPNHYLDFDYDRHPPSNFWYDLAAPRKEDQGPCSNVTWESRPQRYLGEIRYTQKA